MQERFPSFLKAIRCRQRIALRDLVDRYQNLARSTVRRHLGQKLRNRVESEDLVNDFWISIFRRVERLPSFSDSRAFRAYLRRIAFRQVTKQQRRHLTAECRSLDRENSVTDIEQLHNAAVPESQPVADALHNEVMEHLKSHATERRIADSADEGP